MDIIAFSWTDEDEARSGRCATGELFSGKARSSGRQAPSSIGISIPLRLVGFALPDLNM
jgi:hypothetical protein